MIGERIQSGGRNLCVTWKMPRFFYWAAFWRLAMIIHSFSPSIVYLLPLGLHGVLLEGSGQVLYIYILPYYVLVYIGWLIKDCWWIALIQNSKCHFHLRVPLLGVLSFLFPTACPRFLLPLVKLLLIPQNHLSRFQEVFPNHPHPMSEI